VWECEPNLFGLEQWSVVGSCEKRQCIFGFHEGGEIPWVTTVSFVRRTQIHVVGYLSQNLLGRLRKNKIIFSHNSWAMSRDLSTVPIKYEAGVLDTEPRHFIQSRNVNFSLSWYKSLLCVGVILSRVCHLQLPQNFFFQSPSSFPRQFDNWFTVCFSLKCKYVSSS
jgi:hypothetical protein